MTFGQYGEPPLSPAIPTLVADFVDVYVRGDDGRWRFQERHIHRIFVAPDNTGPLGQKQVILDRAASMFSASRGGSPGTAVNTSLRLGGAHPVRRRSRATLMHRSRATTSRPRTHEGID